MDVQIKGPILAEEEFYSLLNENIPALAEVKKLGADGKYSEARRLFAEHVRGGGYAERFFENRAVISTRSMNYNGEKLRTEAQRVLAHELKSVGVTYKYEGEVDWFYNATYNAYPEWTWQLSRHHDILIAARAYEAFGEEKYAECAVELLTSWIKQAVRPDENERDGATLCWRTIECGIRMSVWPDIFFPVLRSPAATDEFILDFCRSLYEHGERLVRSKTQNNWRNIELSGFASLAVLFPFFEKSEAWLEHTASGVYDHLVRQVHPDGFQFELSTGYHHVVLRESIHGAALIELSGRKMPKDFYEIIVKMFDVYALIAQSGGLIPNINDGRGLVAETYMPRDGESFNSPLISWVRSGLGEAGAPDLCTLVLFENAGLVTMRDRWANAHTSLLFDAGKLGRAHQHEDKLNLIICHDGKEILTEGHNYAYDSSDMRKYVLSSFSHNTVLVDGEGQNRKSFYKWDDSMLTSIEDVPTFASEEFDYARGKYCEAYGKEGEITDVVHTREIVFVKKSAAAKACVVVIDTLKSESEHTYEALWHFDDDAATLTGRELKAADMSVLFDRDCAHSVVKGQTEPITQGFVCRSTIQGDYDAIPTVISKKTAKDALILTAFAFGAELEDVTFDDKNVNISYKNGISETVKLPR